MQPSLIRPCSSGCSDRLAYSVRPALPVKAWPIRRSSCNGPSRLRNHSASNPQLYRFANYHNPIYPTCTNPNEGSNDRLVIDKGLSSWTPLFDEFSFIASMEHHTHYRKFTYKIRNNTISTIGTRYIGDGSWGVS